MAETKADGESAVLESVVSEPPTDVEEPHLYQWTVWILGMLGGVSVGGVIVLSALGKPVSEGLVAVASSCVAGLVALLAPRK